MKLEDFLTELHNRHIKLWVEGNSLRYRATKGALTPELIAQLKDRKAEILSFLAQTAFSAITPIASQPHYALSNAQRRLWVLCQIEGSAAYHIPLYLSLEGILDRPVFEKTFAWLIQRHESLRTTFFTIEGEPRQKVHDQILFRIHFKDLTKEVNPEAMAKQLGAQEAVKPFDLETGPLLRVMLLKLAEQHHLMLFTMHHIISDGWSLSVIVKEFAQCYETLHRGQSLSLPPLRIQYRDYAHWQNQLLENSVINIHREYWHQKLSGEIPVLNLPTDFPRPAIQTFNGQELAFKLSPVVTQALRALASQQQMSVFMLLVAAIKVLLYRYTGQEDIIVGTPIAGRNHSDLENQVGFYLNTLALRDTLDGNGSFEHLLQAVKQTAVEAYEHQIYPYDQLVNELHLHRDLSRSPLFDVMVILQNAGNVELTLEGLQIRHFAHEAKVSKVDLTFDFNEKPEGLYFGIEYNTDLVLRERIERMGTHFCELINSLVTHPSQPLNQLVFLTTAEQQCILYHFNETIKNYPLDQTLVEVFEQQVLHTPQSVAFLFEETQLSYEELNSKANQLGHYLRTLGVGPDILVGICLERCLDMVIAMLGILKAGGAYVPLDPTYPQERLAFMLEDSQAPVLVTLQKWEEYLTSLSQTYLKTPRHRVYLDQDWPTISQHPQHNLVNGALAENVAYVIYTSGTTGKPKGVMGLHRNTLNRCYWMWETVPYEPTEVCCQKTSISFVDSVWEIFGPLLQGISNVIISDEVLKDPQRLVQTLALKHITRIVLVPSLLRVLLNTHPYLQNRLPELKYWTTSGEALSIELFRLFQSILPDSILLNLYGSSEVAADTTWYDTRHHESLSLVPIGRPIANTRAYILDRYLQPVPLGVPGELHIGGMGLARGYLHRPELTAEKFISNPFMTGERLYKTGDLARYLPDGYIEYLGRLDHQVKIRGYRIELEEVETWLWQNEAIQEVVVVAKDFGQDHQELVAYFVSEADLNVNDLREYLTKQLPSYMVPTYFIKLDKLPLTPSGKVDKKVLPDPTRAGVLPQNTKYVAPRNQTEQQLIHIWQDILNLETIGIHDNFLELGGNSLKAMKMMFHSQRELSLDLNLLDIFREPTVAGLVKVASKRGKVTYTDIRPLTETWQSNHTSLLAEEVRPLTAEELELLEE